MGPTERNVLAFLFLTLQITALNVQEVQLVVQYFKLKNVASVLLCLCQDAGKINVIRRLSLEGVSASSADIKDPYSISYMLSQSEKIGILLDIECPSTTIILQIGSSQKYFTSRQSWLILWSDSKYFQTFKDVASTSSTPMFEIDDYLRNNDSGSSDQKRINDINLDINSKLMEDQKNFKLDITKNNMSNSAQIQDLVHINAMINSDVTIAVDHETEIWAWNLWEVYRPSVYAVLKIEHLGLIQVNSTEGTFLAMPTLSRNNMSGVIIKAACSMQTYDYFSRSNNLTSKNLDFWAQMMFAHTQLIEEMLDFRMLIKCFDEREFCNDRPNCNSLAEFMKNNEAELTATGVILNNENMNFLEFIDGTLEFKLGVIYRLAALSQTANIFSMPFTFEVWIAAVAIILISGGILYIQMPFESGEYTTSLFGDILSFIGGAICQQGYPVEGKRLSVRVSMMVVLVLSLFLSSAYSAAIVVLLQSPSEIMTDLASFIQSPFELGIEDLPYEHRLLQEDSNDEIAELVKAKVALDGNHTFSTITEGLERVRRGLFAFQCDLGNAYRAIEQTYTEDEKCGLEILNLFPNRVMGPAVMKKSPYRDIFAQRMRWLREVGMTQRIVKRWYHNKPKCEIPGAGFVSVGLTDVAALIMVMAYGTLIAIIVFFFEMIFQFIMWIQNHSERRRSKKQKTIIVWDFIH